MNVPYTKEQLVKMTSDELVKVFTRKSMAIRSLASIGFSRSEIAKMLNIRYQHVRNTLIQELKKPETDQSVSQDPDQIDMFE